MTIVHFPNIPKDIPIKDVTPLLIRLQKAHPKLMTLATKILIKKMSAEVDILPKDVLQPISLVRQTLGNLPYATKKATLLSCIPDTPSYRVRQQAECYVYMSLGVLTPAINRMLMIYTSIKTGVDNVPGTVDKIIKRKDKTSKRLVETLSKTMNQAYNLLFTSLREAEQQLLEGSKGDTQ